MLRGGPKRTCRAFPAMVRGAARCAGAGTGVEGSGSSLGADMIADSSRRGPSIPPTRASSLACGVSCRARAEEMPYAQMSDSPRLPGSPAPATVRDSAWMPTLTPGRFVCNEILRVARAGGLARDASAARARTHNVSFDRSIEVWLSGGRAIGGVGARVQDSEGRCRCARVREPGFAFRCRSPGRPPDVLRMPPNARRTQEGGYAACLYARSATGVAG